MRFLLVYLFFMIEVVHSSVKPTDLNGFWISPQKDFIVECYQDHNGKFRGRLAWFKKLKGKNRYNCEIPENQWIGKDIMWNFLHKDSEWSGGTIKDLKKCNTYDAFITMPTDNRIEVTGFVMFRMLGESMTFSRYSGKIPSFIE